MFSSPLEVHAFELGVLAGIVVAALLVWGFQKSAVLVSIALLFFALGVTDGQLLCTDTVGACANRPVQSKPWYFLTGGLSGTVVNTSMWVTFQQLFLQDRQLLKSR